MSHLLKNRAIKVRKLYGKVSLHWYSANRTHEVVGPTGKLHQTIDDDDANPLS